MSYKFLQKADALEDDPDRLKALTELNKPLSREDYEAFYGDDNLLYIRNISTKKISSYSTTPHRSLIPAEIEKAKLI